MYKKPLPSPSHTVARHFLSTLTQEQQKAYQNILEAKKGLSCIQGYAGTGKSHLLKALKGVYESDGFTVRSFGPDNATAVILQEKGLGNSENIYRFLFAAHHDQRTINKGKEVWILDEAGKLGNKPLLELLKLADSKKAKLILAGDAAQLPSVERGGIFKTFCASYGSEVLFDIQRQKSEAGRLMAKKLAKGETGAALDTLSAAQGIKWSISRQQAMEELITSWAKDHRTNGTTKAPNSSLMIAQTNGEVRTLNEMARLVRKSRGELSAKEFSCETPYGKIYISEGDLIEFRKNDKNLGVTNGTAAVLMKAESKLFTVAIQENQKKSRLLCF
ncbi:MAG: AAA family ATPase, partial [Simkania negevensis]|nr:AAA family ATPase [Simkania negevensis]